MELGSQLNIAPTAVPAIDAVTPASQNLFEAMAQMASDQHRLGVGQVGEALSSHLDEYLERASRFSDRLEQISAGVAARSDAPPAPASGPTPGAAPDASDQRVATVLQSLSLMFDYSIETQMVVRSATQVSGAVNTLLRGQ